MPIAIGVCSMFGIDGNHELFGGLQKRLMLKEKLCKMMNGGERLSWSVVQAGVAVVATGLQLRLDCPWYFLDWGHWGHLTLMIVMISSDLSCYNYAIAFQEEVPQCARGQHSHSMALWPFLPLWWSLVQERLSNQSCCWENAKALHEMARNKTKRRLVLICRQDALFSDRQR